jgi:hypothetical protein
VDSNYFDARRRFAVQRFGVGPKYAGFVARLKKRRTDPQRSENPHFDVIETRKHDTLDVHGWRLQSISTVGGIVLFAAACASEVNIEIETPGSYRCPLM